MKLRELIAGATKGEVKIRKAKLHTDIAIIVPSILAADGRPIIIAEFFSQMRKRNEEATKECEANVELFVHLVNHAAAIADLVEAAQKAKGMMESMEEEIDYEKGDGRKLAELERDNALSAELIDLRKALAALGEI